MARTAGRRGAVAGRDAGASVARRSNPCRRGSRSRRSVATGRLLDARLLELRAERDALAAHDPIQLRAELEAAEAARTQAEQTMLKADDAALAASNARDAAAEAERAAAQAEVEVNRAWREASTELDRLRETYEDEDRLRGDIERRVADAERLLREGHRREPEDALSELSEDDSVESLEKKSELVQRRLALIGRVNLLATGEFEAVQERHDFMARELDDVRKARRDLLEVIAKVDQEISETFDAAYRDVAREFERLDRGAVPRRLWATHPDRSRSAALERHRDRGEPGTETREAHLAAVRRRAFAHRDGVPLRDLHGADRARST